MTKLPPTDFAPEGTEDSSPSSRGQGGRASKGSGRPKSGPTPRQTVGEKRSKQLTEDLAQLYTLTGVMVSMIRPEVGGAIVEHSEEASKAWVDLADRNPRVRKALEDLTTASVWGAVISVHVKMLMPAIALPVMMGNNSQQESQAFRMPPVTDSAMELAMQMMAASQGVNAPNVADTVATNGNGTVGSAEYQPPPLSPDEYGFPADTLPPQGG